MRGMCCEPCLLTQNMLYKHDKLKGMSYLTLSV